MIKHIVMWNLRGETEQAKAAAVATLEPEAEANSALASTVEDASEPGTRPRNRRAEANNPLVRPVAEAMYPMSRNMGTAERFQSPIRVYGIDLAMLKAALHVDNTAMPTIPTRPMATPMGTRKKTMSNAMPIPIMPM